MLPTDDVLDRALADQPEIFAFGSIGLVARKFGVTPTRILRFAHAMGCSGYLALQSALRQAYLARGAPNHVGVDTVRRLDGISHCQQADMDGLHREIRPSELHTAARLVLRARRRLVVGDELVEEFALRFAAQLGRVRLPTRLLSSTAPGCPAVPDDVGPDDVLVAIGVRSRFACIACMLSDAGNKGAATIAIARSAAGLATGARALTLVAPTTAFGSVCSVVATASMVELLVEEIVGQQEEGSAAGLRPADLAAPRKPAQGQQPRHPVPSPSSRASR
jgi:DNA-binding MurR/RpiR family transcriptional regulator